MKLLGIILSFFIIANLVHPVPTHNCSEHGEFAIQKNEENYNKICLHSEKNECHQKKSSNKEEKGHDCNMFCYCGCYAFFSTAVSFYQMSIPFVYAESEITFYRMNNYSSQPNLIWHPPRI